LHETRASPAQSRVAARPQPCERFRFGGRTSGRSRSSGPRRNQGMKPAPAVSSTSPAVASHLHSSYVWVISAAAALGGLLFGYDWVVIGGAKPFYETYFRLSSQELIGWANSCALIGCLAGSIISGFISDRFGRKKLLILSALLFAVSSVFTGWAWSFASFIAWRM